MGFKGLNLDIPAGKTTAIVGMSGSGKTTIAQLLMRIYDVTEGEIILDGKYPLKDLELRFVKASFAQVDNQSL